MVVVPQEEYVQLASVHKAQQPIVQQFNDLTKENMKLEHIDDPYRRLQLQSSNLEERKILKEKMRRFITMSTPRQYRSRAESLFDFVESKVRFNEKGEIMDDSGHVIEKSHIDDLLQHAVRDMRRKLGEPVGWEFFLNLLRRENVPHNIVGSPTVLALSKPSTAVPHTPRSALPRTPRIAPRAPHKKRSREVGRKRDDDDDDDVDTKKKRYRLPFKYYKF